MSRHLGQPARRRPHCTPQLDQRGMAVVSVLVVVAIIAVLAAAMMARQATAIHAAQSEQTLVQGRWLLRGEISRVQAILRADAQTGPATRLDGGWAQPIAGAVAGEVEGEAALLYSEVIDEQSKFNLRNLVQSGRVDPRESAAFLRLCALVGVPRDQASLIARRAIVSLVEADKGRPMPADESEVKAAAVAAAELGIHSQSKQDQAPRLRDLSDLLGESGVDQVVLTRLRPFVTILPQRTWINSNTASPEVLAAWVPGLSMDRAKAMLAARDKGQWFLNRGDFANRLQMPEIDETEVLIGITSQWFRISGALKTSRSILVMQALLHDDKESLPEVVWLREGV